MRQSGVWVFWMHGYSLLDRDESQVFEKAHRKYLAIGRFLGEGERISLPAYGEKIDRESLDKRFGEVLDKALSEILGEGDRRFLHPYGEKIGRSQIHLSLPAFPSPNP